MCNLELKWGSYSLWKTTAPSWRKDLAKCCEISLLLRNDFAAFLHSAMDFPEVSHRDGSQTPQDESQLRSGEELAFCCEMISQPFCTVLWNSSWSFPIFATCWKPNTTSWKPTSQRCEISLLLRSDFPALFVHLQNLADLVFTCETFLGASLYLRPTFEIFFFWFLLPKSQNSPCKPPIIGFLSF